MQGTIAMRTLGAGFVTALLVVSVQAQTGGASSDLPDTFRIDIGGFRIAADTKLKYSVGGQPSETVDFEDETGLPRSASTIWLDGTWRVGRRHQLSLNFTRTSRSGEGKTLTRDITWGDQVFKTGLTVQSEGKATIFAGYYRFAIVRNDRFEVGPALGIGHLSLEATIRGTGSVNGDAGGTISVTGQTGSMTADIGGYFAGWLGRRVVIRGDLLYIFVKPERSEASVTDGRLGLYWYPWRPVGLGAQYKYYKYRYDRALLSSSLGGSVAYQGGQAYVSILF
jgi:hypothetical protein